jgi:hypothetical protein
VICYPIWKLVRFIRSAVHRFPFTSACDFNEHQRRIFLLFRQDLSQGKEDFGHTRQLKYGMMDKETARQKARAIKAKMLAIKI